MNICTTLRIKNEERWIERCIKSVLPFSEKVLVMDDHSEDKTEQICRAFDKVVWIPSPFSGLNEVRDKNYLLQKTLEEKPDWIFSIDGDEEIEQRAAERFTKLLPMLEQINPVPMVNFQFFYFWDSEEFFRYDGIYSAFWQSRLFHVPADTDKLKFVGDGAGFHCGSVPNLADRSIPIFRCKLRIKHFGYINKEDRLNKFVWYNINDCNNLQEFRYEHIINSHTGHSPGDYKFLEWVD